MGITESARRGMYPRLVMLEILGIRTGVVEELDSDDEFDTEVTHGGTYYK
jgi:hypothetical protein